MRLFALFICIISITILCVSREELSLLESNQQIYDFYNWVIIQCNRNSCCEHITGGVNIYLYWRVSVLTPACALCVWNTQQGPPGGTMVPRIDMCRSMILSGGAYQMWHNHPLKQWNKATKRAVELEDIGGERGVGQNLKKEGRQYRGVFIKQRRYEPYVN